MKRKKNLFRKWSATICKEIMVQSIGLNITNTQKISFLETLELRSKQSSQWLPYKKRGIPA